VAGAAVSRDKHLRALAGVEVHVKALPASQETGDSAHRAESYAILRLQGAALNERCTQAEAKSDERYSASNSRSSLGIEQEN
jgi:hypothetical protein